MIEVKNLTKNYGKAKAINNLNFTVENGEILGFLGPNGAGKSTTMKIITGYIAPSQGTVIVDGYDISENEDEVKKRIGYLPENPPLYFDMTVGAYLEFAAELKGIPSKEKKVEVQRVLELLNIKNEAGRVIRNLSKGYKQRVGLAQAILGDPKVLILDEPTVGLDPKQIIEIRQLIKKLGKDRTIILSTHILPEVSQICDRVIIINRGEIAASDSIENLTGKTSDENVIEASIKGAIDDIVSIIKEINGVRNIELLSSESLGGRYKIRYDKKSDIREELFTKMAERHFPILELRMIEESLEDIFIKLTTSEYTQETQHEKSAEKGGKRNE